LLQFLSSGTSNVNTWSTTEHVQNVAVRNFCLYLILNFTIYSVLLCKLIFWTRSVCIFWVVLSFLERK
jgi:hypothetical protein